MRNCAVVWNWPQITLRNCRFASNWPVLARVKKLKLLQKPVRNCHVTQIWRNKRGWEAYTTLTSCENAAYSNRVISIDCSYCFLFGRICPLMQAHFLWPLLRRKAFLLRLNKGSNFLQSAFWIWSNRFSLVRECNVFLQCCITLGPARQFSLQSVKLSRIVTYRSKIKRVNCSLNWSYINLLWRIKL